MSAITSPEVDTEGQVAIGGCLVDDHQAAQNAKPMASSNCTDQSDVNIEDELEHSTGQAKSPFNATSHGNGHKTGVAVIHAPSSPDNEGIE